ncbi:MAG: mroA1 [Mucilaginibacter sp.]|nr:mroA1 [Mucilaginibacter sp.]
MYQISQTELAGHQTIVIRHPATGNEVSVIAGYGGALNTFVVNGRHILRGTIDPGDFESNTVKSFAGSQMFPFPNRVKNAWYFFNGKGYFLPKNDDAPFAHSLHGLVYNKPFEISSINETEGKIILTHLLKADATTYPFELRLTVEYQLNINTLQIRTNIHNLGNLNAPVGYGWHPYIAVAGNIDNCRLQLPASQFYLCDDRLIPNGKVGELKQFTSLTRVGDIALNHCFEMPNTTDEYQTILEDVDGTYVQLDQSGFNFVQCYIPPDRKSIAIEPQTCIANSLNNKIGLIIMQAGERLDLSFKITVKNSSPNTNY